MFCTVTLVFSAVCLQRPEWVLSLSSCCRAFPFRSSGISWKILRWVQLPLLLLVSLYHYYYYYYKKREMLKSRHVVSLVARINSYKRLAWEPEGMRQMEHLDVGGMIVLKWIFKKYGRGLRIGPIWLRTGISNGLFWARYWTLCATKWAEFI